MIMAFGPAGVRAMLSHPGHPVDTGPGRKPERGEFPGGAGEPRVSPQRLDGMLLIAYCELLGRGAGLGSCWHVCLLPLAPGGGWAGWMS
jgi:hypothetical protein